MDDLLSAMSEDPMGFAARVAGTGGGATLLGGAAPSPALGSATASATSHEELKKVRCSEPVINSLNFTHLGELYPLPLCHKMCCKKDHNLARCGGR